MDQKIIAYIKEEISNEPLDDIEPKDDLLGSGIIDSLGMMKLVTFLEKEFQIKISTEDMTIENFMTIEHISGYLSKHLSR